MAELPDLIKDLALILIVASVVTLLFKKLNQPLVLGYIVAGFVVSPHMPLTMSVIDKADIQTWADIGVMFLLFSLGLDFSFKKILKMGMAPVIAAVSIVFSMAMLGMIVGHAFGWEHMDCIFLGGMLAMSSTTIIYKAFDDMGLRQQRFAGLVMSVLILEDILAIVMMVMLSAVASGNNPDGGQMIESLLKIGFFLVLWFVVGLYVVPTFLRVTRKAHDRRDAGHRIAGPVLCHGVDFHGGRFQARRSEPLLWAVFWQRPLRWSTSSVWCFPSRTSLVPSSSCL